MPKQLSRRWRASRSCPPAASRPPTSPSGSTPASPASAWAAPSPRRGNPTVTSPGSPPLPRNFWARCRTHADDRTHPAHHHRYRRLRKSTIARRLARTYAAAYLDKDAMSARFVEAALLAAGYDPGDRESNAFYRERILPLEYDSLLESPGRTSALA